MRLLFIFIAVVPQVECNRPQQTHESITSADAVHFVATNSTGSKGKCPRFQPELDVEGGSVPSMVKITIKSAKNLPKSFLFSRPDPYVEFWMGAEGKRQSWIRKNLLPGHKSEKYWRARTPSLWDNIHPAWEWSCLMTYDSANPEFTAQIWNHNRVTKNQFIGKISGNLLDIMDKEDRHNDGEIDHSFPILRKQTKDDDKKGAKRDGDDTPDMTTKDGEEWVNVMGNSGSSKNREATISVKFELIRETTRYSLTKGSGNALHPQLPN